jgi:peptide/nickel transport system permease protein
MTREAEPATAAVRGRWSARLSLARAPWTARIAAAIVLLYFVTALFAPVLAPHGEAEVVGDAYAPATSAFPLGTDQLGRDILSRLIYGAQNTIAITLATTLLSFAIGVSLGLFAAIRGGLVDQAISRAVDALMSIPTLIFALMLMAIAGRYVVSLILILGLLDSARVYRLARATAMDVVVMEFFDAARLRGESTLRLMFSEILPNVAHFLAAEFGIRFCYVLLTISALSFLGVGLQPPAADWGSMVAETKTLITYGSPAPLIPAAAIALLAVSVNFLVDWYVRQRSGRGYVD